AGFIAEVQSYLPKILEGIDAFSNDPARVDHLAEAYRHSHCIKGAASMVGLADLSHLACQLEEALEEITLGQLAPTETTLALLRTTVAGIESYLESALSGTWAGQPLLAELTESYRRLRGTARGPEDAGVEALLRRFEGSPTADTGVEALLRRFEGGPTADAE